MSSNGYIKLHRKILDSWQWETSDWGHAWVTMMLMAEYEDQDEKGLRRGQFFSSIADLSQKTKLPETSIRRFLKRCLDEKDLIWEKAPGGRKSGGVCGGVSGVVLSRFTITKFDYYNGVCGGDSGGVLSSSSKRKKKKEKNSPSNEGPRSANSQVYDFFVRNRRIKAGIKDWEPTKQQAIIMRANIKKLLDKGAEPEEIIGWLTNYFADDRQEKDKWPWTFFMSDPIRWSSPIKVTPSRYEKDDNSNNPAYKPL